jgi:dual specificity protein phosphatase-like protein
MLRPAARTSLDVTHMGPKLYQGSYPRVPIAPLGFAVLVLCAIELQERVEEPGLLTLRCPLTDTGERMSEQDWALAIRVSGKVARHVSAGERTLVSCAQGRNRSGLITALVLYRLTDMSGLQAVSHVQKLRFHALENDEFVHRLCRLPRKSRLYRGDALSGTQRGFARALQILGVDPRS